MGFETGLGIVLLLMAAAFVAGFVDSIAGGGGLITLPALLIAGTDPVTALATNKVQGLFGAGSAATSYALAGQVDLRRQVLPALIAYAAAVAGALLATMLPVGLIRAVLPVLLIGIALFFALKPGLSDIDRARRVAPTVFILTLVPLVGFYDGLLGPGAGSFYMIGFVALAGYGVLKATAHTKLLNFASNLGAMTAFVLVAKPWWLTGLAMGAAQAAGATLGAKLAVRIGAHVIKPVLVATSTGLAIKVLWDLLRR
ncbi:MAG: TSUP family transporter [Steroidobacteraceae bacterium]